MSAWHHCPLRLVIQGMAIMTIDQAKYQNAILYIASKLGGEIRGKKKLAKLLYFIDFDFFEKFEQSITGDVYRAQKMGPLPTHLSSIIGALSSAGKISIESIKEWEGLPTEVVKVRQQPDTAVFTESEMRIIDRVIEKYGKLSGKQLEDLSHAEAPYIGTEAGKEIAYELAFYRGTDFDA